MAQNETPIILDETEQKIMNIIDAHRRSVSNRLRQSTFTPTRSLAIKNSELLKNSRIS